MTCDEAWESIHKGIHLITRGERSALIGHLDMCRDCLDKLMNVAGPPSPERDDVIIPLLNEDLKDPEFYTGRVRHGREG